VPLRDLEAGFPELCAHLRHVRATERVGHAYLFIGDNSELLEKLGRDWIQVCVCREPTRDGEACGTCELCRQIAAGSYRELHELRPRSKSRQILVQEMRDFDHGFHLTTAPGVLKAGLIVDADRLTEQSQNAFLKTLEEPPERSLLVLLTTQPRALLPTIRSRCQVVSALRNRRSYESAIKSGLPSRLARLGQGVGAAVALEVSMFLQDVLADLRGQAEASVEDEDTGESMEDQDSSFKKRLADLREARVQAEYLRLRQQVSEAIQTWFLQQHLLACGATPGDLPNPEFRAAAGQQSDLNVPSPAAADSAARAAVELGVHLTTNADERLCLDAFCLAICKRIPN